jgi:hypothetical protein
MLGWVLWWTVSEPSAGQYGGVWGDITALSGRSVVVESRNSGSNNKNDARGQKVRNFLGFALFLTTHCAILRFASARDFMLRLAQMLTLCTRTHTRTRTRALMFTRVHTRTCL